MSTTFRFEARGPSGRLERGALQAESRNEALERLRRRRLTPTALTQTNAASGQHLNDVAARDLTRTLAQLLRSGLSFTQALRFASEELPGAAAAAAARMREAAERGEPASSALDEFGGSQARLLSGVVSAGEVSGRLSDALDVAATAFARSAELRARLSGALIYPCFVVLATLATLASFLLFVVPTMGEAFAGSEQRLPESTRTLLALSAWLRADGALVGLGAAALLVLSSSTPSARAALVRIGDRIVLSPLGLGVASRLSFSGFASLAALSLQAGVPTAHAFEAAAQAQRNHLIKQRLAKTVAAIRMGDAPSAALERFAEAPSAFVRLVRLGEETGKLGETLKQASALLSSEAEQRLERLGALAGPAITLVLGGLVASVVMSLFLGLLSISDAALT